MAWQLIYTSAPRLLEAGRTGFGTVARHRAVSGMLASSVERFSQFARLPGHDTRRIIHACRILTVGSGTYHVLSCLQDAGSDYTGRTNHIAHHLIVEPREVRSLAAAGITPVDVLLSMRWRATWTEGPRYLDAAEEVDLSSFKTPPPRAWASITGSAAYASILWSRDALKGCYLITPPGVSVLELFQESLLKEPAQCWQCRFTTCLEPTDDPADFRWVALPDASPLRLQVESSSRLVLDLTAPATLPAPPEPEPQADNPAGAGATSPQPPQAALPMPSVEPKKAAQGKSPTRAAESSGSMGEWAPEPRQRPSTKTGKSYIGVSLLTAAVLILIVGGGLLLKFNRQKRQRHAEDKYASAIAKTWREYDLKLDGTRKFLEAQSDVESGQALLDSHNAFFHGMRELLNKPGAPVEPPLPMENQDDLRSLSMLLKEWSDLHNTPWKKFAAADAAPSAPAMIEGYNRWQEARNVTWRKLREYVSLKHSPPPAADLLQALLQTAKKALGSREPAQGSRQAWEQLFQLFGDEKAPADADVALWLAVWAKLEGPDGYATAQKEAGNPVLPQWLRAMAAEIKPHASKMADAKTSEAAATKDASKHNTPMEDADSPTATNAVFIHLLQPGEDISGQINGLPVAPDMQLYAGSVWDAHPLPEGKTEARDGELRKWASISLDGIDSIKFGPKLTAAAVDTISFSAAGSLTALPESYRKGPDGIRMVARSKDGLHVLFDLRILPAGTAAAKPVFAQVIEATADNTSSAVLHLPSGFLARLRLGESAAPVYWLRRDGSVSEQKIYSLKKSGDSSFVVMPPQPQTSSALERSGIERQIKELEAGILKDNTDLAELEGKKISAREKDAKREFYTKNKSNKEILLQELQSKLQAIDGQMSVHFDLMPGDYTLIVEQPGKAELCRLCVSPAAAPNSKSTPP